MTFKNVVGQQAAKDGLLQMWHNNVFPHALLIVGPEGTGGLPMALALAQYIFCENKSETDACGKCAGCGKAAKLEHADLHVSFPSISPKPGTKALSRIYISEFREFIQQSPYGTTYDWLQHINAENKQGNITAEECREIIDTLNLKSYEGGKKVQIIWRPEYLGKEGNILLKLIEEPPQDTILILVAEQTDTANHTLAHAGSKAGTGGCGGYCPGTQHPLAYRPRKGRTDSAHSHGQLYGGAAPGKACG